MYHPENTQLLSVNALKFVLITAVLSILCSCAGEDTLASASSNFDEFNPNQISPNQSAVGALFNSTGYTGCSVAFLSDRLVVTAARCVANQPAGPYFVINDSPATQSSLGLAVSSITVHPLWNSIDMNRASEHIDSVRQGLSGYYHSNASYDLAILELSMPKLDGIIFEPNRSEAALQILETLFYANAPTGTSRSGGSLTVAMSTPTTLTVTQYSLISTTGGGGAAMITLDNGRGALIGIASGGDGQGMLFTQISAHQLFVSDVIQGLYSPINDLSRYRIEVTGSGTDTQPNPNPNPNPNPTFDCATTSDGFCDRNCRSGQDLDCIEEQVERTGDPFGAPCQSGVDCITRLCLGIDDFRKICSDRCNPHMSRDCPPNFDCIADVEGMYVCAPEQMMSGGGSDPVELRLFGADCDNDAQCTTQACITHQGSRWCSMRCMQDDECPLSYVCGMVSGGRACVPPQ